MDNTPLTYRTKRDVIDAYVEKDQVVLDVGFWGQGIPYSSSAWPHRYIKERAAEAFGIDLQFDESVVDGDHYKKASAEDFQFDRQFDRILAFDLIEHLPNPGLFLEACQRHLKPGGKLIVITPNCYSLFNMAMKLTREDPVTNSDHTCYFNPRTLRQLVGKVGLKFERYDYLYSVGVEHEESLKKKFLNVVYRIASRFTGKYCEDFVAVITA